MSSQGGKEELMEEYFTCERYRCTMKRKHCISRIAPASGIREPLDPLCLGCSQGRQIAAEVGVEITALEGTRICKKCGEEKPVGAFTYDSRNKGQRLGVCRECRRKSAGVAVEVMKRKCTACGNVKPINEFPVIEKSYMAGSRSKTCGVCLEKSRRLHAAKKVERDRIRAEKLEKIKAELKGGVVSDTMTAPDGSVLRRCSVCKRWLPLEGFALAGRRDGEDIRQKTCPQCIERYRRYRENDKAVMMAARGMKNGAAMEAV